jgi:glycosyltransferase involved in cell wall biosynthesis
MSRAVTVLIPTRNRADYLGAALASVNAAGEEARRRFGTTTQALVVDDVSTDDGATRRVAQLWGARYHRIEEHDGHHDPGLAITTGLSLVDSDVYQLLGDDDVLLPHALSTCLAFVADGADVVSTSYWTTDADLRPTREVLLPQPDLGDLVRGHSTVCDGSIIRTDAVQGFELDVSLKAVMLLPLWVSMMLDGRTFAVTPYPTWLYRRHTSNISSQVDDKQRAARQQLVAQLKAQVVDRLGELPPSPREDAELARQVAREEQKATRDAEQRAAQAQAAARAERDRRPDVRARRRLARFIAP